MIKLPMSFALGGWMAVAVATATAGESPWTTLGGCSLEAWEGNDGDSFLVQCPGPKHGRDVPRVFRLYYVDTPESEDSLPERLEEQRAYWNLPDIRTVVKLGEEAKRFSRQFLSARFHVHTLWEDAMGRTAMGRQFAMLSVDGNDLGLALVRNGLARVYGKTPEAEALDRAGGYRSTSGEWWGRLRQAEALAKRERQGCWAYSGAKGARLAVPAGGDAVSGSGKAAPGAAGSRPGRGTVGPRRRAPLPAFREREEAPSRTAGTAWSEGWRNGNVPAMRR
jgi:endonuclease YncB( thermonuclease family)